MPFCTHCGTENAQYAARCQQCGKPLPPTAAPPKPVSAKKDKYGCGAWIAGCGVCLVIIAVAVIIAVSRDSSSRQSHSYPHAPKTRPAPVETKAPPPKPEVKAPATKTDEEFLTEAKEYALTVFDLGNQKTGAKARWATITAHFVPDHTAIWVEFDYSVKNAFNALAIHHYGMKFKADGKYKLLDQKDEFLHWE